MVTEIQRIPGNFTLPNGWPKIQFPDYTTKILYDWWADDLKTGAFTKLYDRVNSVAMSLTPNFENPSVAKDSVTGHNYINFNRMTRLVASIPTLPQKLSMGVVYQVDPNTTTGSRLISGELGYRSVQVNPVGTTMKITAATAPSVHSGILDVKGVAVSSWQAAAMRFNPGKEIYAQILNNPAVSSNLTTDEVVQNSIIIGASGSTVPSNTSSSPGLTGKISRVVVWDRVLTDLDIEAFLNEQRNIFKLA